MPLPNCLLCAWNMRNTSNKIIKAEQKRVLTEISNLTQPAEDELKRNSILQFQCNPNVNRRGLVLTRDMDNQARLGCPCRNTLHQLRRFLHLVCQPTLCLLIVLQCQICNNIEAGVFTVLRENFDSVVKYNLAFKCHILADIIFILIFLWVCIQLILSYSQAFFFFFFFFNRGYCFSVKYSFFFHDLCFPTQFQRESTLKTLFWMHCFELNCKSIKPT